MIRIGLYVRNAIVTWVLLTIEILATATIYTGLSSVPLSETARISATLVAGVIFLFLAVGINVRRQAQSTPGSGQPITINVEKPARSNNEARDNALVHKLAEEFIRVRMEPQLPAFYHRWETLMRTPLERLSRIEWISDTVGPDFGLRRSDQVDMVITVIAWAVYNRPSVQMTSNEMEREAESRGLPLSLAHALAGYLEQRLKSS
jgi:hypothetical protein